METAIHCAKLNDFICSNRRLLWADALEDNIGQVDFNGKRRQTIVPYAPHPFGLTMVSERLGFFMLISYVSSTV